MKPVTVELMSKLQKNQKNIRNVCILAHVDHGKTTLADSILASNGIISKRLAGKLRYLDSRKDEQERGITVKSSAVSVHYSMGEENYLINLIDSPGHVDFSGEVSTAVRLCDGAIVVVDVVEGICPQTIVALRQVWIEHIQPVLVLNKIDRLILERKLTPIDAHVHLQQILEQVNAVVAELFTADILGRSEITKQSVKNDSSNKQVFDWSSGLDESDDSSVYFSPDRGNVVFASALDGWGFGTSDFAKLYSAKLGIKEDILKRTLWGDFYLNAKTKHIMKGAQAKAKKPLFVQFVLENIWAVYEAVAIRRDKEMTEKIINALSLKVSARDLKYGDAKSQLRVVCGQWLPLSNAILEMVCLSVPSPLQLNEERVESLMCSSAHRFDSLPTDTKKLKKWFLVCNCSGDAPVIVCVSKMFPVERKLLPQNKQRPLTPNEIAQRREQAKQHHANKLSGIDSISSSKEKLQENTERHLSNDDELLPYQLSAMDTVFIAFARVFSGTIFKGQQLYVLGPKHDPSKTIKEGLFVDACHTLRDLQLDQHVTSVKVEQLFLLMGKELEMLNEVPAGNVLGIGGLEEHVLKSATLSTTVACPPFTDLHMSTVPILRIALEPACPSDMPSLVRGMKLLNQADPCVQVLIQESGEHVLVTAGEVHLQRCLDDLRSWFAKIDINVSSPIVPFRETIIVPPKLDMVNEAIEGQPHKASKIPELEDGIETTCSIIMKTPNRQAVIGIQAIPLPEEVTKLLEQNSNLLKDQDRADYALKHGESSHSLTCDIVKATADLKLNLQVLFDKAGPEWKNCVNQIWSFGPKRCGPNILLNRIPGYKRPSLWLCDNTNEVPNSPLYNYDSSFISGFQLATLAGPLCAEPMMGVCFIVNKWEINQSKSIIQNDFSDKDLGLLEDKELYSKYTTRSEKEFVMKENKTENEASETSNFSSSDLNVPFGPFTGQIMSAVKEACRRAFQAQPQRLMTAMYSCSIQVATDMLGKMYAVLGRRHGRALHGDMKEGSQMFHVTAVLPVVESFDFANEIRKQTSGMATPQLVFSHWEVVDIDPFWVPNTEEEYVHFGEKADSENRARKYMNSVRRRKGLPVDEKIVEHAEKQRTLTRNK